MNRRFCRRIARICLFVALMLGNGGMEGLVWCVSADGGVALEKPCDSVCPESAAACNADAHREHSGSHFSQADCCKPDLCGGCFEIPVGVNSVGSAVTLPVRDVLEQQVPVSFVVIFRVDALSARLSSIPHLSNPPPFHRTDLLILSVCLRM